MLDKYRARIALGFAPGALDQCLSILSDAITNDITAAAKAVVELVKTAKFGKCLILLPYDEEHKLLYASCIEGAISKHMIPLRLDNLPNSEAIYTSFAEAVRTASAVIADITLLNENVMYEIGYAHGLGLVPLIYTREEQRLNDLPVYFRTLNVRPTTPEKPLEHLIDEYLNPIKRNKGGN